MLSAREAHAAKTITSLYIFGTSTSDCEKREVLKTGSIFKNPHFTWHYDLKNQVFPSFYSLKKMHIENCKGIFRVKTFKLIVKYSIERAYEI